MSNLQNILNNQDETEYPTSIVTKKQKNFWHWIQLATACVIKVVLMIIAFYLSWKCSNNINVLLRLLFAGISATFSEIYIIYYAVYRVFMGNSCPI